MRWINAAAQLACLFLVASVIFPLCLVGCAAGVAWTGLVAGFRLSDLLIDWVTGNGTVWATRVNVKKQETPR